MPCVPVAVVVVVLHTYRRESRAGDRGGTIRVYSFNCIAFFEICSFRKLDKWNEEQKIGGTYLMFVAGGPRRSTVE